MTRLILSALACMVLTGGIGLLLVPILRALKAGQSIRKVGPIWHGNKSGTPMMGGLMFILGAALCLLGNLPFMEDTSVFYVLALGIVFGAIGFFDDFCKLKRKQNLGLTAIHKAMLQVAASLVFVYVMYMQGILTGDVYIPFANVTFHLHPFAYAPFAVVVMVGCVNAANLTDGLDGLCASVTIPVMVFLAAAGVCMDKLDLALLPACLVGGLVAYLFYNWHPAKVFMGDTGSLFLGGIVCGVAFALDMPLVLILIGFVYIVETVSVILQVGYFKLSRGKRLFKMAPIHHHFEMCGWKEVKVVIVFAMVSLVMCILARFGIAGAIG